MQLIDKIVKDATIYIATQANNLNPLALIILKVWTLLYKPAFFDLSRIFLFSVSETLLVCGQQKMHLFA